MTKLNSGNAGCFEGGGEMMESIDTELLTVNILIEYNGELHMVAMKKDNFEAVSFLTKRSIDLLIKTGKTQTELLEFLNYKK